MLAADQADEAKASTLTNPKERAKAEADKAAEVEKVTVEDPHPHVAEKAGKIREAVRTAASEMQDRQKTEERSDAAIDVTTIVHRLPSAVAVAEEAKKGYDLLVIGLDKTTTDEHDFHPDVTEIAQGFVGPLLVTATRSSLDKMPNQPLSILVPVNGTEQARRGAEIALVMARATRASLTVLYVAPVESGRRRRGSRRNEEAILKDIVGLAGGYNMSIRTAVLAGTAADDAILKEARRRNHNLIVMGVARRPGEKLFFGDTAAGLLSDSETSLLFVAT
jgi:nucleotide-binding universal stress UspA family protein